MIILSKLSKTSQDFLFSFNGTAKGRTPEIAMALATALVSNIDATSHDAGRFASEDYIKSTILKLSSLNEFVRISPDEVSYRYRRLAEAKLSLCRKQEYIFPVVSSCSSVEDFFGLNRFLSENDIELIKTKGNEIYKAASLFLTLFNELNFFND